MLKIIVEVVLKQKILPTSFENRINQIVWEQNFSQGDLEALNELMDKIERNEIAHPGQSQGQGKRI